MTDFDEHDEEGGGKLDLSLWRPLLGHLHAHFGAITAIGVVNLEALKPELIAHDVKLIRA